MLDPSNKEFYSLIVPKRGLDFLRLRAFFIAMSNYKKNLKKGHFKVNRSIFKHNIWLSEPFSRGQAWIDLIGYMTAYKDSYFFVRGNRVDQPRGWACTSIKSMSERWKWSQKKVKKFLKFLEKEEQIKLDITRVITKIEVLNYEKYQVKEEQTAKQKAGQKKNRLPTIKESNKKEKESNNSDLSNFFDLTKQEDKNKVFPKSEVDRIGAQRGLTQKEMKPAYDYWLLGLEEKNDHINTIKAHRAGFERYLINSKDRWKKPKMQSR